MTKKEAAIEFCAGAGTVTGANFLFEAAGKKFLIDCGLLQSSSLADEANWAPFSYDPKQIEALFITHAHIDHIGRIPKLYADGFRGKIFSTPATKELALPMLLDTVAILGKSQEYKLHSIYTEANINAIMQLWQTIQYHESLTTFVPLEFRYRDAGHILGSGMLEISFEGKRFLFTGDLGNSPSPLLKDTESITDIDYLIMESVYGDRNHESRLERRNKLEKVIEDNYKRKGTLIVPTFSLERTQELLFEINALIENERIPRMPIFLDSPLAIKLTAVYHSYRDLYNDEARKLVEAGDDIFTFPGLRSTLQTEESKDILHAPDPKIIIAGSGMSNGGRIIHHEKNYLPNPNNTILLIGYQSMGTLGRAIEDGAKVVKIFGEEVKVKARIETISGYSGHKDSDHLLDFVSTAAEKVTSVFVVMGEPRSSLFLAQKLRDVLGIDTKVPKRGERITLSW